MKVNELKEKTLGDILNSNVKFLDLEENCPLEKHFDLDYLDDLQKEKIKINSEKKVGNKVFIRCNFDWILVCENDEVKEIFNVYDLEDYKYDKDIDCIIVTGHETLHRYIISSGKYKVTHTR